MTMDTAGKAVLFSGVTVLISLSAVMLVPSPAFRSMSLGIMLAVIFVLAATLTLLPAVLAKLGPRVDKLALAVGAFGGEHRSARFAAWAERLWRRPLRLRRDRARAARRRWRSRSRELKTAMPSIKVVPTADSSRVGYDQVQAAFGPGATGPLQIVAPAARRRRRRRAVAKRDPGIAAVAAACNPAAAARCHGDPQRRIPPTRRSGQTIDRLRAQLPAGDADRRRGRREPRPRGRAVGQDAARDRRRPRRSASCCCWSRCRRR